MYQPTNGLWWATFTRTIFTIRLLSVPDSWVIVVVLYFKLQPNKRLSTHSTPGILIQVQVEHIHWSLPILLPPMPRSPPRYCISSTQVYNTCRPHSILPGTIFTQYHAGSRCPVTTQASSFYFALFLALFQVHGSG